MHEEWADPELLRSVFTETRVVRKPLAGIITGYHVLPYFLGQWDRFKHIPLGVLAHSTHVRGDGRYQNGTEYPRARVTLATKLPPEDCAQLALGYQNPADIDITTWQNREAEGIQQWRHEEVYLDGQRFATLDVTGVQFSDEILPELRRPK